MYYEPQPTYNDPAIEQETVLQRWKRVVIVIIGLVTMIGAVMLYDMTLWWTAVDLSNPAARPDGRARISVAFLLYDTVPQDLFTSTMPKTAEFIDQAQKEGLISQYVMSNYNAVGLNSIPNKVPLYSGCIVANPVASEYRLYSDPSECRDNYITKRFEAEGYLTLTEMEEAVRYIMADVANPGTQHVSSDFTVDTNKLELNDLRTAFTKTRRPILAVEEFEHAHANNWDALRTQADEPSRAFLSSLYSPATLQQRDTITFLIGDHGPTAGQAALGPQGQLHHNHPMLRILVPRQLERLFPAIPDALSINQDRLISAYDIHKTLLHISSIHYTHTKDPAAAHNKVAGSVTAPLGTFSVGNGNAIITTRSQSRTLFDVIPVDRTCHQAGVPKHWCMYQQRWVNAQGKSEWYTPLVQFALTALNELKEDKCASFELKSVTNVYYMSHTGPNPPKDTIFMLMITVQSGMTFMSYIGVEGHQGDLTEPPDPSQLFEDFKPIGQYGTGYAPGYKSCWQCCPRDNKRIKPYPVKIWNGEIMNLESPPQHGWNRCSWYCACKA